MEVEEDQWDLNARSSEWLRVTQAISQELRMGKQDSRLPLAVGAIEGLE